MRTCVCVCVCSSARRERWRERARERERVSVLWGQLGLAGAVSLEPTRGKAYKGIAFILLEVFLEVFLLLDVIF